jgi:hypothetical protein
MDDLEVRAVVSWEKDGQKQIEKLNMNSCGLFFPLPRQITFRM